ncbi:MAG: hypothetical protein QOJ25_2737 [Solirubrobacteraceae bacterium]|nr:hypothetical protein [Solirubrobacteraceae bacterium]
MGQAAEDAYVEMRAGVEADTGLRPCGRRIHALWSRRGGVDCLTEVGRPDPVMGGTVLAIFDVGPHQPFVVRIVAADGGLCEVLSPHAYSVTEFER